MGDFFYYGQKDTIRRLNELAGRGAVVASYAPAVGRSPLGGPNGYMNPAWLDPSLPIQTNARLCSGPTAKYGYQFTSAAGQRNWYKLATFAQDGTGTQENLLIRGTLNDGWASSQTSAVTILMGVRGGFYVDWHLEGVARGSARIIVYKHPDLTYGVYAFFDGYANATFDLVGVNTATHADLVAIGHPGPAGTTVFDTSAMPGNTAYIPARMCAPDVRLNPSLVGTSFNYHLEARSADFDVNAASFLRGGVLPGTLAAGQETESFRLGISGQAGIGYGGSMSFLTSSGNKNSVFAQGYKLAIKAVDSGSINWTSELFSVSGTGQVYMPLLKAGSTDASTLRHNISRGTFQGSEILYVGIDGAVNPSVAVLSADGNGGWNSVGNVLYIGKNSIAGRSVSAAGTVNTMGNDYAEYIFKSATCGIVASGQIVGITADNKVTDQWADAIMFSIKSTAPSFVGGDSWANDVGRRPSPQAGQAPTEPLRREDAVAQQAVPGTNPPEYEDVVTEPGDTDEEWAEKLATYTAALAAHNIVVQQDAEAMAAFEAALEVERQKVDRIAIAGRVPVNVLDTQSGDYIVPVQDGTGIKGISIRKADLTHSQYLDAVGRVISIEPDGRAYVMVKAV